MMRVGYGFDIHKLEEGVPLRLGGITIPNPAGLKGHSDGDALIHAIIDALLGAAGLGDIGTHFPDTDPQYRGADSQKLLMTVAEKIRAQSLQIENVDATIIAQSPKLLTYMTEMKNNLAKLLKVGPDQINLKAKTHEGLDALGRSEGIAVHAVASLQYNPAV